MQKNNSQCVIVFKVVQINVYESAKKLEKKNVQDTRDL